MNSPTSILTIFCDGAICAASWLPFHDLSKLIIVVELNRRLCFLETPTSINNLMRRVVKLANLRREIVGEKNDLSVAGTLATPAISVNIRLNFD